MNRPTDWLYDSEPIAWLRKVFHCRSDWLTHSRHIAKGSGADVWSATVCLLRRCSAARAAVLRSLSRARLMIREGDSTMPLVAPPQSGATRSPAAAFAGPTHG